MEKRRLLILVFLISLLLLLTALVFYRIATANNGETLSTCTKTSKDTVDPFTAYKTELFTSKVDSYKSYDLSNKTNTKVFSISDFENNAQNLKEDIFFKVEAISGYIEKDKLEVSLQYCNSQNKAPSITFVSPSDSTVSAITLYGHGGRAPKLQGKYRIDALVKYEGKTYLVDRLNDIEFK